MIQLFSLLYEWTEDAEEIEEIYVRKEVRFGIEHHFI